MHQKRLKQLQQLYCEKKKQNHGYVSILGFPWSDKGQGVCHSSSIDTKVQELILFVNPRFHHSKNIWIGILLTNAMAQLFERALEIDTFATT